MCPSRILFRCHLQIDSELVLPKVRAHIEKEVNNIAAGEASIDFIVCAARRALIVCLWSSTYYHLRHLPAP